MTEQETLKNEEEVLAKLDNFDELPDAPPKRTDKTFLARQVFRRYRGILVDNLRYRTVNLSFS